MPRPCLVPRALVPVPPPLPRGASDSARSVSTSLGDSIGWLIGEAVASVVHASLGLARRARAEAAHAPRRVTSPSRQSARWAGWNVTTPLRGRVEDEALWRCRRGSPLPRRRRAEARRGIALDDGLRGSRGRGTHIETVVPVATSDSISKEAVVLFDRRSCECEPIQGRPLSSCETVLRAPPSRLQAFAARVPELSSTGRRPS